MKKIDTQKIVGEKSSKVVITLTKPYLIEGKIAPAGTKILVESSDIYDDYVTPDTISDASVPDVSTDIYTMRRLARMRKMDAECETPEVAEQEDEDIAEMKRFRKMYKMFKAMEDGVETETEPVAEGEDSTEPSMDDEEIMALRRLRRMRRMRMLRR